MLVCQPSSYARAVEAISTIVRNMHFLLNTLRCHQVCAYCKRLSKEKDVKRLAQKSMYIYKLIIRAANTRCKVQKTV